MMTILWQNYSFYPEPTRMATASPFCPSKPSYKNRNPSFWPLPIWSFIIWRPESVPSQADCRVWTWELVEVGGAREDLRSEPLPCRSRMEGESPSFLLCACSLPVLAASSCYMYHILKINFVLAFHMDLMVVRRIFFKITNLQGKSVFRILIAWATNSHISLTNDCLQADHCCWGRRMA